MPERSTKGKPRKFFHDEEFDKPKTRPTAKLSRTQHSDISKNQQHIGKLLSTRHTQRSGRIWQKMNTIQSCGMVPGIWSHVQKDERLCHPDGYSGTREMNSDELCDSRPE